MTTTASRSDLLFIGDPWDTLDHPRDSTLHLAQTAHERHGAASFWATPDQVFLESGELKTRPEGRVFNGDLHPGAGEIVALSQYHSIHWRLDPPVDISTMRLWSLLAATGKDLRIVNEPRALLTWNEKFAPMRFLDWAIPGLVSDSVEAWKAFLKTSSGKRLLAKPSGDAASRGVTFLPTDPVQALQTLKTLRAEHGPWLVLQEFDEQLVKTGETRVFILDGEIRGAINKMPHPKHEIMNLDVPAAERPRLTPCEPEAEQRRRALEIGRALKQDGVYLATIDFIGDRVLEINVTSAGLIKWLDSQAGRAGEKIAERYWQGLFKS